MLVVSFFRSNFQVFHPDFSFTCICSILHFICKLSFSKNISSFLEHLLVVLNKMLIILIYIIFKILPYFFSTQQDLLQDFESRIANWSTLPKMADVIVKKGPFLKLYTTYIREFSAVNYHFDECCAKYPKFAKLVRMS